MATSTTRGRYFDAAIETLPAERIAAMQAGKLRRQLDYLKANSPFHARKLAEAGAEPGDIRSVADLAGLPFTEKAELRESQARHPPLGEHAAVAMAPVAAAEAALGDAGVGIGQLAAVKTHNPFVVNDLYFAEATGFDAGRMNDYGSSLIFGHPQGPTGLRLLAELIEELALRGGGYGLFTGCAAGDTGAAVAVKVDVR